MSIMISYLDGQEIGCSTRDCAAGDRYGQWIPEWHRWQQREDHEMELVCEVLDEVAYGCAACWVTREGRQHRIDAQSPLKHLSTQTATQTDPPECGSLPRRCRLRPTQTLSTSRKYLPGCAGGAGGSWRGMSTSIPLPSCRSQC